jgi:hypothetical protein
MERAVAQKQTRAGRSTARLGWRVGAIASGVALPFVALHGAPVSASAAVEGRPAAVTPSPASAPAAAASPAVAVPLIPSRPDRPGLPLRPTRHTSAEDQPPIDGDYRIGDLADDRPVHWPTTPVNDAAIDPFYIAVSKDGVVIGYVRSDALFASGIAGSNDLPIFDAAGRVIGHYRNALPVLDATD